MSDIPGKPKISELRKSSYVAQGEQRGDGSTGSMKASEPVTGGGGGGSMPCAVLIEPASNGYILRLLGGDGEEFDCLVFTDRSELLRELASKLG
jgi:hypothetical protein